jgi:ATP-dependent helicase HrpA
MTGLRIPEDAWRSFQPTPHLLMRFEVLDDAGDVLAAGRDLDKLRNRFGAQARAAVQAMPANDVEKKGLSDWPDQDSFEPVIFDHGGVTVEAVPTLIDRGETVDLQLIDDAEKAQRLHHQAVIRLLILRNHKASRFLKRELDDFKPLAALRLETPPATALVDAGVLQFLKQDTAPPLLADLLHAVVAAGIGAAPRTTAEFESLAAAVGASITPDAIMLWDSLRPALKTYADIRKRLSKGVSLDWITVVEDINDQLAHLIYPGCISHAPDPKHLQRYLQAIAQRLDKLGQAGIAQDKERLRQIEPWWHAYKQRAERAVRRGERTQSLVDFRWMVEEYRVQIFAQPLGTAIKVSPKRLQAALDEV